MRAKEFISELYDVAIHDPDLGSELDIVKQMQNYRQNNVKDAFYPDERVKGAQDIAGGGLIRQARAIQNTAPSFNYPKSGATGSTTSPMAHDTTPVIPINIKRVSTFEPPEKVQGNALTVNSMANKLAAGKELPPIAVRATPKGYEVIDGHHRLAAHQQAGSTSIPAKVVAPENIKRINDPSTNWGYDQATKDFLKPGFGPKPKPMSYTQYQKNLAKQTKK